MKLGAFGLTEHYKDMALAGYDYAELDMPELAAMSEAQFADFMELSSKIGLPILTGARILPIVEPTFFVPDFNKESLKDYLKHTCSRAASLGICKVIFGNGKARSLPAPEMISLESKFIDFLSMLADIAGENGQELILEPLGPKYSNYLNTISQAVEVITKVHAPNLYTMADLRHMVGSHESLSEISAFLSYIHHVHVDYPLSFPQRSYPSPSDDYDYSAFVSELKKSGYQGTLTIEADIPLDWGAAYHGAMEVLGGLF